MSINKLSRSLKYAVNALSDEKIKAVVYVRSPAEFYALKRFGIVREYPFISAVGIECPSDGIMPLLSSPSVEYVTACTRVSALADVGENAGVLINAGGLTGRGARVVIMDTGVSPHLDFCLPENRLLEFKDFVGLSDGFYDDNGHGTFVAGIAAGNGLTSGKKYGGVAPEAEIVGIKVIGKDGEGGAFNVLDGMQWLLDNRERLRANVCCMSFGSTPADVNDPLRRGAETLVRNGITVVAASGNGGGRTLKSPAISPEVISVGAVDDKNKVADFTSRGVVRGVRKPEIYAKGVNVISTLSGACYGQMTGTSVAAPYIAGACCLLYEKYGNLPPRRVKEMLLRSCTQNAEGEFILDI